MLEIVYFSFFSPNAFFRIFTFFRLPTGEYSERLGVWLTRDLVLNFVAGVTRCSSDLPTKEASFFLLQMHVFFFSCICNSPRQKEALSRCVVRLYVYGA